MLWICICVNIAGNTATSSINTGGSVVSVLDPLPAVPFQYPDTYIGAVAAELIDAPNIAGVSVTPVPVGAAAVNTAPVPVGAVNTIVGADVHPFVSVAIDTLAGTPPLEVIVPVIEHPVPPPVDVNAVDDAYPVPDPLSVTTYGTSAMVGSDVHPKFFVNVSDVVVGTPELAFSVPYTVQFVPPPTALKGVVFAYPVPDPPTATVTPPNA
jgi:hypothetical protein